MLLIEVTLAVAACAIALLVAASMGGSDPIAPTTFASAGIDCAPSPGATGQVFLKANATDYEIIAARLAIASVPGVTIDQYLDHQGAFAQLACVFPDAPDLVHSIRPVDLPVSFVITADVADTNSAAHLRALPNVRSVVTPESWSAWWTSIA
jgi:cell division protein FtsX